MSDTPHTVEDDVSNAKFLLRENGETCFADYRRDPGELVVKYVFAPEALRGTGAASRLMEGIAGIAKAEGRTIVPICGYAASWLRRHRE